MSSYKLSIIIVSYNTCDLTVACIESVLNSNLPDGTEIIVWDNASSDDSAATIKSQFDSQLQLITSEQNLGFAKANNEAVKIANGEYVLLLNPDTLSKNDSISNLIEFAVGNPQFGIFGGRTEFADGTLNPASCWSTQTLWSLTSQAIGLTSLFRNSTLCNPEGMGAWRRDDERVVDIVSGCFLLIKRELWHLLGGFSQDYFMYGEDADLCLRASELGYQSVITPSATIVHYGGASERVRSDKLIRLLIAKTRLINDHFDKSRVRLARSLLAAWPLSRAIASQTLALLRIRKGPGPWPDVWKRRTEWRNG